MSLETLCSIHTVTVQIGTVTAGAAGGQIRSFANVRTGAKCRCRPMSQTEVDELAKRGQRVNWRVYFSTNPNLTNKHRLKYADELGVEHLLYVQTTNNPHEMDRFWKVDCLESKDVDNL